MSQAQTLPNPGLKSSPSSQNNNQNWLKLLGIGFAIALLLGASFLAYIWFSGGSGQASVPTAAPILTIAQGDSRSLFHIIPEESEVRFVIEETLLGNPKTVVGVTQNLAGDLLIDWENPANSLLGEVRVNVRTLETDNEFRNRALRGQILHSDMPEYEFASFVPTSMVGLPETIAIGDTVEFQIIGFLTLHGVSRELTFNATLTAVSQERIEGSASTEVRYADFGLSIPEAAGVANVSETLRLEIDFVATSAE